MLNSFNVEDGLPSSHIYETFQDRAGYLWVCTDKGVARFDGYEFKMFTVQDGLSSNDVWGIIEDQQGRLWLNIYDQLAYIKDEKVHTLPLPNAHENGLVYHAIREDCHIVRISSHSGNFFQLDNQDRLIRQNPQKRQLKFPLGKYTANKISSTLKSDYTFFKIIEDTILFKFNFITKCPQSSTLFSFSNLTLLDNLQPFVQSGEMSLINNKYLIQRSGDTSILKIWEEIIGQNAMPYKVAFYNGGKFSLSTDKGYVLFNPDFQINQQFDLIHPMSLNHLYQDRQGNSWISTNKNLYLLTANATNSTSFRSDQFFEGAEIISMTIDSQKNVWLGTHNGLIYQMEQNKPRLVSRNNGSIRILQASPWNDIVYGGNYAWGTISQALKNKNSLSSPIAAVQHDNDYIGPTGAIKSIIQGEKNDLWFTAFNGVFRFTAKKQFQKIDNERAYAICTGPNDEVWVSKSKGLVRYQNDKTTQLEEQYPVLNCSIRDLQTTKSGALWIATDGLGLFRYTAHGLDTIKEVTTEIINHLHVDSQDHIWAASNSGIIRIKVTSTMPLKYDYRKINTAHGLLSSEVNDILVNDETIYAATKDGLTLLPNKTTFAQNDTPSIKLQSLHINEEKWSIQTNYELDYTENNIRIKYICFSYKSLKNITYQYKIEGIDHNWQQTQNLELRYPALAPGKYTFRLKATDIDGITSPEIKPITFLINPPWWRTNWFLFLSFLSLSTLSLLGMQWRINTVRQKAIEQNKINKQFAELELQALQAQMNPHFVFNALQAIQDFIFNKDELVANQYLVKFSRLMRLFLESSKEKYIFLADELELLRLYIDLEKMRFEDQFNYTFDLDSTLVLEDIEIPSMLLQPFVENAINHGLIYKKTMGSLTIRIRQKETLLHCQIIDDGIGREQAKVLKAQSYKSYKSRGMQLVEERQRVLEIIDQSKINIKVEDLINPLGIGCGTIVNIEIRYDSY